MPSAADDREQRPVDAADRQVRPRAPLELLVAVAARAARSPTACAIVNESIAPNAYIRPRKSTCPESRKIVGPTPREDDSESHGVFSFGCSRRNDLRQLPVARHRVGDPRRADHARVRRDEEDRRGEDADVDLRRSTSTAAVQAEVLDEAEHRVVLEAVRRRLAELRHVVPARRARRASPRARSTAA